MGFKVIIVGGSVAGLTLANILERLGVDFTLLEAYPEIAPQVGASIGLLPNGFRILDQIQCYEPIREIAGDFYLQASYRDANGKATTTPSSGVTHHLEARTGYPSIFIDRQMLLQVLYDNLQQKNKVNPSKRVNKIDLSEKGVTVYTTDGSIYEGDIVVGADGIHSTVRSEMWRIGIKETPGYFPHDEQSRVPVDTRCIFGISKRPANLPAGRQITAYNDGWSYLIVDAPGNRTYWFLFEGVGETKRGKDIPRYSKEDTEKLALAHMSDRLYEEVTFGDIYKNKIMATLVPLEEYVFEKWHYKRIVCIGDASHKIDPVSGQGGNGAIEAAALLGNAIAELLEKYPGVKQLSTDLVENAVAQVHAIRYHRAKKLVSEGHNLQQILTGRSPFSKIVTQYLVPILKEDGFLNVALPIFKAGPRVEKLTMPKRGRLVPFDDELPAKPITARAVLRVATILSAGSFAALLYHSGGLAYFSTFRGVMQMHTKLFLAAVAAGSSARLSPYDASRRSPFHSPHLGVDGLLSTLTLGLVEGHRVGNRLSVLLWPTVGGLAYTAFGPDAVAPLLGLGMILQGSSTLYGRHVPPRYAKSILPSVVTGLLVPAVIAALPVQKSHIRQAAEALVAFSPIVCSLLTECMSAVLQKLAGKEKPASATKEPSYNEREDFVAMYRQQDVPALKFTYACVTGLCGAVRVAGMAFPRFDDAGSVDNSMGPLARHFGLFGLASVALSWYNIWTMRSEGFITTKKAVLAALVSATGSVCLGPGAGLAATSYWRETVMASLSDGDL
ncbi:FAD-dependent monooxygenase andE [Colletotrichum siamense]|uniref:FAD-dependent monooxygenase andE n=1 Tax=Colletotrichum siamense TaxID=690259 RepID=A0A9P5BVM4_COLSI|nr:FAD-dependent monooxygenase andE [Colletotrichum siamense]KAF4849978.1 FAD-dependent monooxygenase andE [Colletotrichum siamense]